MPNHVAHRILCTGPVEDVAAFKKLMIKENQDIENSLLEPVEFDFNAILPQPPILERVITKFGSPEERPEIMEKPGDYTNSRPATDEEWEEIKATGSTSWYDWNINHWGTKWNSYSFAEIENKARYEFSFDTAWSPPEPVIDKLVEKFPNLNFGVAWFDEGWCHAGFGRLGRDSPDVTMGNLYLEPNPEVYKHIYGEYPNDEVFELSYGDLPLVYGQPLTILEQLDDNLSCRDVFESSDDKGYFPLVSQSYSDDPTLTDDELFEIRTCREKMLQGLSQLEEIVA